MLFFFFLFWQNYAWGSGLGQNATSDAFRDEGSDDEGMGRQETHEKRKKTAPGTLNGERWMRRPISPQVPSSRDYFPEEERSWRGGCSLLCPERCKDFRRAGTTLGNTT
jgi:hypothetical protein